MCVSGEGCGGAGKVFITINVLLDKFVSIHLRINHRHKLYVMAATLEKIISNPINKKVLKFLDIEEKEEHSLTWFEEKNYLASEGLKDFLEINVPANSKFILDNFGVIVLPSSGEIIAFHFGRNEIAFKILNSHLYRNNYMHIRKGLIRNLNLRNAFKVSLGYFSNIYNDANTIVDIRKLGSEWALSIYFPGEAQELITEFYNQQENF